MRDCHWYYDNQYYLSACIIYKFRRHLVAFRVVLKILVLLKPLFVALFLLFNIIPEINIDYNRGLILLTAPLATQLVYIIHIYFS